MIIVILGPTGSGKSDIALGLAAKINASIINGDAFQVYEELRIATNKPSEEILSKCPHFLYDFVPLDSSYSVAEYQQDARSVIDFLLNGKQNIIIEGGTGLYVRAALFDYVFSSLPKLDESKYDGFDNGTLFEKLMAIDPKSAARIHPNNRRRIMRALAIADAGGLAKSELEDKQAHKPIYEAFYFAVDMDREELHRKIDDRVDWMFANGLLEETLPLIEKYGRDASAFQAIGVHELFDYIDKKKTLGETIASIKLDTRHYVRRQMTFIRHQFDVNWVKSEEEILIALK